MEDKPIIMKKIIKKYGDSLVIVVDREDSKILELKEGDVVKVELEKIGEIKNEK